jgi:unsaturated rhamnogalacturonyl hydrolase
MKWIGRVLGGMVWMIVAYHSLLWAQTADRSWSVRAADAAMERWPGGHLESADTHWAWNYELGTLLMGVDAVWMNSADPRYYNYIKSSVDAFVGPDGTIPTWKPEERQLDNILLGRQLLLLYGVTQDARYAKAATLLYEALKQQPRTASGGFWHKQRYPNQMWLDGLYMAEPFYAEYAATFNHPEDFSDIAHQFALADEHLRDSKTGLLYHGWDESGEQRWADKASGHSSQFWGRAMGWQMMALVDTLHYFPEDEAGRKTLITLLQKEAEALVKVQDQETGLWYQVLDKGGAKGNYLESSASCMFVYALAKGVRQGYLAPRYLDTARRGYQGILAHFVTTDKDKLVSLSGTVKGIGLGGNPYHDGSYGYYVGEKVVSDDPRGVGAFLLASTEMENAEKAQLGRGKIVLLDAWFNSQTRADAFGHAVSFHYKWNDESNSGYSLLGHIFRSFGARTKTLYSAPEGAALTQAQVYILVSPDIPAKNPNPHYVQPGDVDAIAQWVKAGGVLMLMENDPGNADLEHFNLLAERFGIHYNNVLRNTVEGKHFEQGEVEIPAGGPIFHQAHHAFMKEICTIGVKAPAKAVLRDRGDVLIATAKYGKGTVFATVDPWFYNEYMDGRKLPDHYDNYGAAQELAGWILGQNQ